MLDLHSTNGTYVNGKRISSPTTIRSGDRIQFGNNSEFTLEFKDSDDPMIHLKERIQLLEQKLDTVHSNPTLDDSQIFHKSLMSSMDIDDLEMYALLDKQIAANDPVQEEERPAIETKLTPFQIESLDKSRNDLAERMRNLNLILSGSIDFDKSLLDEPLPQMYEVQTHESENDREEKIQSAIEKHNTRLLTQVFDSWYQSTADRVRCKQVYILLLSVCNRSNMRSVKRAVVKWKEAAIRAREKAEISRLKEQQQSRIKRMILSMETGVLEQTFHAWALYIRQRAKRLEQFKTKHQMSHSKWRFLRWKTYCAALKSSKKIILRRLIQVSRQLISHCFFQWRMIGEKTIVAQEQRSSNEQMIRLELDNKLLEEKVKVYEKVIQEKEKTIYQLNILLTKFASLKEPCDGKRLLAARFLVDQLATNTNTA